MTKQISAQQVFTQLVQVPDLGLGEEGQEENLLDALANLTPQDLLDVDVAKSDQELKELPPVSDSDIAGKEESLKDLKELDQTETLFKNYKPAELRVIQGWFTGSFTSYAELARKLNVSPQSVAYILAKPEVLEFAEIYRKTYAMQFLMMVPRASKEIYNLAKYGEKEETRLKASKNILMGASLDKGLKRESTYLSAETQKVSMQEIVSEIINGVETNHKKEITVIKESIKKKDS